MKIAVLGTGTVGRTLAGKLLELGHDVTVGTRVVGHTLSRDQPEGMGAPPFRVWLEAHPGAKLATFAEAATPAEIVINATSGAQSLQALEQAGAASLDGKIVVDVSNPLDFSKGMPPTLFVKDTDSLAEQIQRAHPGARVVKTFNTVTAPVMVEPGSVAGGEHTMFLCGDDAAAKAKVRELLQSFGWRHLVDLGDLTNARGMEMWLALWIRLYGALKTPMFNLRIVT